MDLNRRAEKLAALIEEKLGAGGSGLAGKLAHTGRALPRHLRRELGYVVQAIEMQDHPRLAARIDWDRIARGFAAAEVHLARIDPTERRKTAAINWLAGNAFNLLVVLGLVAAVVAWRGLW